LNNVLVIFVLIFFSLNLRGQTDSLQLQQDSAEKKKAVHKAIYWEARKAAIMSAIIPGLGQAYNRKYWKIPVIYGGLAGLSYIFKINHEQYTGYRTSLRAAADLDSSTVNTSGYSLEQLRAQKIYYKKNRDFAAIGVCVIYLLNIIDANVDAHLKTFDVSDDLGMIISPAPAFAFSGNGLSMTAGISIKLKFK
jgi:hypothetical protein